MHRMESSGKVLRCPTHDYERSMRKREAARKMGKVQGNNVGKTHTWEHADSAVLRDKSAVKNIEIALLLLTGCFIVIYVVYVDIILL